MKFEIESQLSVRCFRCGCFGHRGPQCENYTADRRSQNSSSVGMEKCWICGCLGHIAVECKEERVTCFSCGKRGHKQEDCTSPMANCWNCGEKGHIKKDCPVKKNVGMCFYCHKVGHHSKDCRQKVCYICQSKDHLCTRCPQKRARSLQPYTNWYSRRSRHPQREQDHQMAFQQGHVSKAFLFDTQCYQSFGQQQQVPPCIRPKSEPLSFDQKSLISPERPMPMRMRSDPIRYSTSFGSSIWHSQGSQSMESFDSINQSYFSAIAPHVGLSVQADQDWSEFSMPDVFSRSDESTMKVTKSENDRGMSSLDGSPRSLIEQSALAAIANWRKDISSELGHSPPTWSPSNVRVSSGSRVELNNRGARQSEKQELTAEYNSVNPPCIKVGGENTILDTGNGQTLPVQDKLILQPTQETQTSADLREEVVEDMKVETLPNVINNNNRSPSITSTSTRDSSTHLSISTMSNGKQKEGKAQTAEGLVPENTAKKINFVARSNAEYLEEIETEGNDVNEELTRVIQQLAKAKLKLHKKEEQLDKTRKIVKELKKAFLDSLTNKKFCPNKSEQNIEGEDFSNRCPNCIQKLKNFESCEECML